MAHPLAATLAVIIALTASAQPAPKNPQELKADLLKLFSSGADVSSLDVSGQPTLLVRLFEQAKYVQSGREPGDEKETHVTFVRSVARRLGAPLGPAIELYGDRVRPNRTAAASQSELDARSAIAADVMRNPGITEAKKERVTRDLAQTSALLRMGVNGDANFAGGPAKRPDERPVELNVTFVGTAHPDAPVYDSNGVRNWSRILPRVQPRRLITSPTPSPVSAPASLGLAATVAQSWESLKPYLNWEGGVEVAAKAYTGTLALGRKIGMCWKFVKQAFIDAFVFDVPNPQSTGLIGVRPDAAAMFAEDVKKNPAILDKMSYRHVDLAHASDDPSSVPDGSLLIYARGCSFADPQYGHAELTLGESTYASLRARVARLLPIPVDANEVRVCHYSCTKRSMPFLRTYGKKGCLNMYVPVKST